MAASVIGDLLADPQLLLRLNPCLTFERLECLSDGRLRADFANESNGMRLATEIEVLAGTAPARLTLRYATGIKRETRLGVTSIASGARIEVTEVYAAADTSDAESRLGEVDRSLLPWVAALRRHLLREARWGFLPGYAWWSRRFWPSMTPGQRRVAWLLIWTTALEFVVFAAVLAIYLSAGG